MKVANNKRVNILYNNKGNQKIAHFFCKFADQNKKKQWLDSK